MLCKIYILITDHVVALLSVGDGRVLETFYCTNLYEGEFFKL